MSTSKFHSTVLITGGTNGLGYQCALILAAHLPNILIVLASRTDPNESATSINETLKQANVVYMPLDLGSLATVRDFSTRWSKAGYPPISALVLNAGVQFPGDISYTSDGFEKHFGINHVGHALLFHLLTPYLTPTARIIVVSSGLHDPEQAKKWGMATRFTTAAGVATPDAAAIKESKGRDRYATSKAANAIWAFGLGRHMSQHPSHTGKTVLAFDPGLMFGTSLSRDGSWFLKFLNNWIMPKLTGLMRLLVDDNINTPEESGGNMAWLVEGMEVEGKKGVYFEKRKVREASVQARDEECQEDLWKWTVENVAQDDKERARFAALT